ncbi:MAG: hypothetical protein GY953_54865 [bacterium]|nr:hypothetical protein [bacterium]
MPDSVSFGDVRLDVGVGESRAPSAPEPDTPFRMTILGDFSGRDSRDIVQIGQDLAQQRPLLIDRDNFDDVMEKLGPRIPLPEAGEIQFREMDDFHPDQLYGRVSFFDKVRTAAEQISKLPLTVRASRPPVPPPAQPPTPAPKLGSGSLLDQAVEETERGAGDAPRKARDNLQAWLDEQVAPHLEPRPGQRVAELRSVVAATATAQMRAMLHYPTFQQLEASWRALYILVRRVETSVSLKLYLVDISKEELAADLGAAGDLRDAGVYRLLSESSAEAPHSVLVGDYAFGADKQQLDLLARLGTVAGAIGAPLIAAAHPSLAGCRSFAEDDWTLEPDPAWQAFRRLKVASSIGLAAPRWLLRLPYGADTDPCELLALEEMGDEPDHGRYLWGNPALVCGCLLAESFAAQGWDFRAGDHRDLDGLPLHTYTRDGEPVLQSPAEASLSERAAERALERGLMPLVAPRNTDSVRVMRFQSVADPAAPLLGRWGQG